jgi:hypothetical protein
VASPWELPIVSLTTMLVVLVTATYAEIVAIETLTKEVFTQSLCTLMVNGRV